MPNWEYHSIYFNDLPLGTEAIDLLNNAGSDGWELINIVPEATHHI